MDNRMSAKRNIGIITFQWLDNYGTVLQAYALQTVLDRLGYDAHIVNLEGNALKGIRRFLSKSLKGLWKRLMTVAWEGGNRRHNQYDAFRRKYFKYGSKRSLTFKEALSTAWSEDVLVWGSDNIWGPWCVFPDDGPMARLFYGYGINHPRKIAYAASTGAPLELHQDSEHIIDLIRSAGFDRIGLRETCNVSLLRGKGVSAELVPDPSLLLMDDEWAVMEDTACLPMRPYVFGYELGHVVLPSVRNGCEAISKTENLDVRIPYPKAFWSNRDVACFPTPFEWVALVRHAECVVTDSFHGVMFSLIFNRPFLFIQSKDDGGLLNMRAHEILRYVWLESRVRQHAATDTQIRAVMSEPIDWERVRSILMDFRKTGITFLEQI